MVRPHVLLMSLPAQGHINPSLQLAKRLIGMGVKVTFIATVFAHRLFLKSSSSTANLTKENGFNIVVFTDGHDDGYKTGRTMIELQKMATNTIKQVIHTSADESQPVMGFFYDSLLVPWASELARECHVQSAVLWTQPAVVFDICHYYFNGFEDEIKNHSTKPDWSIRLAPGLPSLKASDLPSFLLPSSPDEHRSMFDCFKLIMEKLDQEERPTILVNTFDALEPESIKAIDKYNMIGIGPLIPSAFLDGKDPSDTSYSFDLFDKSKDYMCWLNSLPTSSLIYVSFGSILTLPKQQMEEVATGLLRIGKPFLWVLRDEDKEKLKPSCIQELVEKGKIVSWCSQLEVLTHPSLACFVSHVGWNSALESLCCGVPVVAFPQWTEQGTVSKMIQDVWETGVRVIPTKEGLVERDEIERCIKLVMDDGETALKLRRNAMKWKELAREAMIKGGTSSTNLAKFIDELGQHM